MWIEGKQCLSWVDASPSNTLALHYVLPHVDGGERVSLTWVDTNRSYILALRDISPQR